MAKNSIRDYSATNSSNTDIQSIDISEGCSPAGINNAIREVMADLKDVSTGAVALESPAMDSLTVDTTGIVYSGGNVGIGHVPSGNLTAGYVLRLDGGSQTYIALNNDTHTTQVTGGFVIGSDSTTARITQRENQPLIFDTNDTERMRIDSSGNVSLGNGKFLQFKDSGGTARDVITIDAYNGLNINSAGGGSAAPIVFKSNNAETMRIDSSGNLLVGCTSLPSASVPGLGVDLSNASELRCSHFSTGNSTQIRFLNPNGEVGSIRTNGSGTNFNTSSDYRLKENVVADWDATTRLKQLNPVRFNFISDADTTVDGFLAHEVQTVVPEAISGTKDAVDDDGNPVYQGIDQSKLVPLLVKTIQELEARIAALEAN